MVLLLLLVELVILYFITRRLTQRLYELFLLVFRIRSIAIMLITLLHFPGTVLHELSHLFTAEILGVRTGKLELAPESIREDPGSRETSIKAGSVVVAQSDPFRAYAIGLAPVLTGIVALTAISYFLPDLATRVMHPTGPFFSNPALYFLAGSGYLIYAISTSMFSSSQDLKGFIPFALVVGLFILAGYVAGVRIGLTGQSLDLANRLLYTLVQSVGLVLALNAILLLLAYVLIAVIGKITNTRIQS